MGTILDVMKVNKYASSIGGQLVVCSDNSVAVVDREGVIVFKSVEDEAKAFNDLANQIDINEKEQQELKEAIELVKEYGISNVVDAALKLADAADAGYSAKEWKGAYTESANCEVAISLESLEDEGEYNE